MHSPNLTCKRPSSNGVRSRELGLWRQHGDAISEHASAEHPLTLYAATKKANEQMAHSYSHLYGIPSTGLRFFTVYGPWGRPDMALFLFTRAILEGKPIRVFNTAITSAASPTWTTSWKAWCARWTGCRARIRTDPGSTLTRPPAAWRRIASITSATSNRWSCSVTSMCWSSAWAERARMEMLPLQAGDVPDTEADVSDLIANVDYRPVVPVEEGISRFVDWYRDYYRV